MPEEPQVLTNHAAATRLRTLMAQLTHEEPALATHVATRLPQTQEESLLPSHRPRHHEDHPEAA
jgi:hypothetical protein